MKFEKPIKIALIVLPILVLILFVVPGMVSYVGIEKLEGKKYILLQELPSGTISNTKAVNLMLTIFTLVAGIFYKVAENLGAVRLYMIFGIVNTLFAAAPLVVDKQLVKFPYLIVPVLLAGMTVFSLLVMRKEQNLYYERMLN